MNDGLHPGTGMRGYPMCPKCRRYTLRRSSRYGGIGMFRAKYTDKRMYRCRGCRWKGWLSDGQLRYPTLKEMQRLELGFDSDILRKPQQVNYEFTDAPEEPGGNRTPPPGTAEQPPEHPPAGEQTASVVAEEYDSFAEFSFQEDVSLSEHIRALHPGGGSTHRTARACPKCGNISLHRSHTRSFVEDIRKRVSPMRPYRCNKCQWRGWLRKE